MKREALKLVQRLLRGELRKVRRRKRSSPLVIAVLTIAVFGIGQWLWEPKAPLPAKGTTLSCKISQIYDGDTVAARCNEGKLSIRVFGIDAPEMGQKPWGKRSLTRLQDLIPSTPVRLKVIDQDRYGRVVAQLYNGNRDLGLELVRQGWAAVYAQYNDSPAYRMAQAEARRERRGIWSQPGAQQEPWEWRKLNPR